MKTVSAATAIWLMAALAALAQPPPQSKSQPASSTPPIRCQDEGARPCTAKQIAPLTDAVFAQKRQHDALAQFKELTVESPGRLKCAQLDGTPCTLPQLDLVKEIGLGLKLYINYNPAPPAGK